MQCKELQQNLCDLAHAVMNDGMGRKLGLLEAWPENQWNDKYFFLISSNQLLKSDSSKITSVVCLALCISHMLLCFVKRKKINKIIFPQDLKSSILLHQLCDKLALGNNWQRISPALFRWKSAVSLNWSVLSLFLSGDKIVLLSVTKFLVMSISKADISNALTAWAVKSYSIPSVNSSRDVLKI